MKIRCRLLPKAGGVVNIRVVTHNKENKVIGNKVIDKSLNKENKVIDKSLNQVIENKENKISENEKLLRSHTTKLLRSH